MALKQIDLVYRTMFAELSQRTLDAQFQSDFPVSGRFVSVPVKSRRYWYFEYPTADGDKRRYVGPADDPDIGARVEGFSELKQNARARRTMVRTLLRDGGMSGPDRFPGDITDALATGGLFRLRAVLIGTVAFQCYAGLLGVSLPSGSLQTGDADYAQDFAISAEVGDSLPPILDLLQSIDPSFRAIPHRIDRARVTAFVNKDDYRVEFLTGNRGSDDHSGRPSLMPALGGASAENLRYLDYLIYEPVRTVMLHRSGVSILVPAPERYAVHKLIVAAKRRSDSLGRMKREKDAAQAGLLFEALSMTGAGQDLADAYEEARERGVAWRDAIDSGFALLSATGKAALAAHVKL